MKRIIALSLAVMTVLFMFGCGGTDETEDKENNSNNANVTETAENNSEEKAESKIPFKKEDFVVEITPNGEIDSAGGVEYSYTIENKSSIPVQEFAANVKFEFEDGQKMMETIGMYTTIMDGEKVGVANETTYPEPASKIKSHEMVSYQLLDENGTYYDVDLQLDTVDKDDYGLPDATDEVPFALDDFTVEIKPNGNIDSAGGVEYSYEIQNNAEIPVKEISFDVKFEFEDGQSLVDTIGTYETLMNGDKVGESNMTTYPEPASKIKSYKIIGYQLLDKNNLYYDVDTQLEIVNVFEQ